jgi:hypothetical protein
LEFTGTQPEECTVAEQALALEPGKYRFSYSYRSSDIAPGTGLKWQILDPISNSVIEESSDLSSDEVKQAAFSFSVPPGASVLRLRLNYRRALGTPRITGTLMVLSTKIQATSQ